MKLLLTSGGISNKSIEEAFLRLVGKPAKDIRVAFVPTAANVVARKKNWLIEDMNRFNKIFPYIDIVDPTAIRESEWKARLDAADIIVISGGNPFYLLYSMKKTGFDDFLKKYLDKKVIVGISAGSMVMGKFLAIEPKKESREYLLDKEQTGLGLADFSLIPHMNSEDKEVTRDTVEEQSKIFEGILYGIDNDTAIVVEDDKTEVVSEGEWEKFE